MLSQSAENPGVTLLFKWHFAFFIDYELDCCCCRGERFVCIFCSILNFFFFFFCNWESAKPTIFNRSACRDSALFSYCSFRKNLLNKTAYICSVFLSASPSQLSDCKEFLDKQDAYWCALFSLGSLLAPHALCLSGQ